MLRKAWHSKSTLALVLIIYCAFYKNADATPATVNTSLPVVAAPNNIANNFKCPQDCQCVIPATHHPQAHSHQFLHATCTSINGLKSDAPFETLLPIHSVNLSYAGLTRLSHALDKLHDVTSVDLSHNELHEFGHLSRRIKKLNLKHNRITSNKLSKLPPHLQVLNLQHNDITNLPLEFTRLVQLQTLELSHNPINCSCETLEVRNWLQERHVFMENAVKCSYPARVKDMPWLQVKHTDVCKENNQNLDDIDDSENELMLGDQPAFEGSAEQEDDEELGKDYMPVADKSTSSSASNEHDLHVPDDVEGSGDLSELSMRVKAPEADTFGDENTTENPDEDLEDGSGSGAGVWPVFTNDLAHDEFGNHDDFDSPVTYTNPHAADDSLFDNKPVEEPAQEATPSPAVFHHQGIFDPDTADAVSTENPLHEEAIVPVVHSEIGVSAPVTEDGSAIDAGVEVANGDASTEGPEAAIMQAKVGENDDSNATYFLLGVIALIVVGLILFVAIKRCKNKRNARNDAENPRQTELLDMDKKNLGKPLYKEHAPLIGDKSKSDLAKPINGNGTKPYDANDVKDGSTQNQPLLKNGSGNGAAPNDEPEIKASQAPSTLQAPHEYYPITPRYPTPKSPRASKYAQYPQGENNNNTINADDAYLPSSPKSGRYSPVYSPETGRVKVKLTETPRPKTPMVVTITADNAINGSAAVGVHSGTNGHAY